MKHAAFGPAAVLGMALAFGPAIGEAQAASVPRAVTVARTTVIPRCTLFVDAGFAGQSNGTALRPHKRIAAAIAAARQGAIICVAAGVYRERLTAGTKAFTLAGGFQRGRQFTVRDSALFVSRAQGDGTGSFFRAEDPGPSGNQLTAIDGFEITGYSQAIVRDIYYSQRFNITNNNIHDNVCAADGIAGAGFSLNNVSGVISGNVFARNRCWRGGAGFLNDSTNANTVVITRNLVEANAGTEPGSSHGGAFYLFTNRLTIQANTFLANSVTGWGAGLYVGAYRPAQETTATLTYNVYRGNRAGNAGGGLFCDDAATCLSDHEIFSRNCGGNIYLDSGGGGPTVARFDHLTNFGARAADCVRPGAGVQIDSAGGEADSYSFTNSIFWGNALRSDFATSCSGCGATDVRISYSMVQRRYLNNGVAITFGPGIVTPVDPRFVAPAAENFHLKSRFGHWTPRGYRRDTLSSPALAKGDPAAPVNAQPPRAGPRTELGAYGNSPEASYVR